MQGAGGVQGADMRSNGCLVSGGVMDASIDGVDIAIFPFTRRASIPRQNEAANGIDRLGQVNVVRPGHRSTMTAGRRPDVFVRFRLPIRPTISTT